MGGSVVGITIKVYNMKPDLKGKWIGKPKDATKERKAGKHKRMKKLVADLAAKATAVGR